MAVRSKQVTGGNGINITHECDTSADYGSISNSTYFRNLEDGLIRYKTSGGLVLDIFSAGGVTGSGTLNYLPKFTPNGTTLGNSLIFESGNNVNIGTANLNATVNFSRFLSSAYLPANIIDFGYNSSILVSSPQTRVFGTTDAAVGSGNGSDHYISFVNATRGTVFRGDKQYFYQSANNEGEYATFGDFTTNSQLVIKGRDATSTNFTLRTKNSANTYSLQVRNDGSVYNLGNNNIIGNTAFGINALIGNNSGNGRNTAFGNSTLSSNTAGEYNTAIGVLSLFANQTGNNNVGIGSSAFWTAVNCSNNIGIGWEVGFNHTSGNYNTMVGDKTFYQNVTGSNNTGFGSYSLNATLGSNNVALGYAAGYFEQGSGTFYIDNGVGLTAGTITNQATGRTNSLIYGNFNATVTSQFLQVNGKLITRGGDSTSSNFNFQAKNSSDVISLQVRNDGSVWSRGRNDIIGNTAYGIGALGGNNSGNGRNTAFGDSALFGNTTGEYNIAVGLLAKSANQTGNHNIVIGNSGFIGDVSSSYNVGVGAGIGYSHNSGNYNTVIGNSSFYINVAGENNTSLGAYSLYSALGSNNVALGYFAGAYETGSNSLYIDGIFRSTEALGKTNSLIYGVFNSTVSAQRLNINATVAMGLGVAVGTTQLLVRSLSNSTSDFTAQFQNFAGTNSLTVKNDGNVGIGVNSPSKPLDLYWNPGNVGVTGARFSTVGAIYHLRSDNNSFFTGTSNSYHNFLGANDISLIGLYTSTALEFGDLSVPNRLFTFKTAIINNNTHANTLGLYKTSNGGANIAFSWGDGNGSQVIGADIQHLRSSGVNNIYFNAVGVGNFGFNTSTFGTSASGVLAMANGTAPTTSVANVAQHYTEGGVAKYRDDLGNIITI